MVVFYAPAHAEDPLSPFNQSILWGGLSLATIFTIVYGLAIYHRKNVQLHSRYMACTALVFLLPGLNRVVFDYIEPIGVWVPAFYQLGWTPFPIAVWLILLDWRKGRIYQPQVVFSFLWMNHQLMWILLPKIRVWNSFSAWAASAVW